MTEKLETDVDAQDLARDLIDLNEIEVRPGLTIVRSETLGKFFVRESLDRLEDLPPSIIKEIEDFLTPKK
jgi:hypothetical protein